MQIRHLFLLLGFPAMMSFQVLQTNSPVATSKSPTDTENRQDSLSTARKKRIKEVRHDKTRIHHIKKVEPTTKKTIN